MLPDKNITGDDQPVTIDDLNSLSIVSDEPFSEADNRYRTEVAASAVLLLAARKGLANGTEPAETAITDLLANLMHLCAYCYKDGCGTSFDSLLTTARMHFSFESEISEA